MASFSGARPKSRAPQVFLNFRGKELRRNFVDYLVIALKEAKINVFIDDHEEVGRNLNHLLVRIEQSRVAIVIFSKEYTTSVWCLKELVKIKECMEKGTLTGIPIFYKVNPSVVKNLEGDFGDKLRKLEHDNRHDLVNTEEWEEALTSITEIIGVYLREESELSDRKFIKTIVKKVKRVLDNIPSGDSSMIFANKLNIIDSDKSEIWRWSSIYEPSIGAAIDIVTMNEVGWMDITANLHTRTLTPETKYEAVFVVKLEDYAVGWHVPVTLTMKLIKFDDSEIPQERTVVLDSYIGENEWVDIKAGDFIAPLKDEPARIYVNMYQHYYNAKKTGLVVKGATIREVTEVY